jgi:hypothetical protein
VCPGNPGADLDVLAARLGGVKARAAASYLNLLAVAKAANASKSDHGPAAWTPSNVSYRCQYAIRWVCVVSSYGLAVTDGDPTALRATLSVCAR